MDKTDLIYEIVCRMDKKLDEQLAKMENKLDKKFTKVDDKVNDHIAKPHVKGYSVKQIGAVSGIITALSVAIGSIIKIFV